MYLDPVSNKRFPATIVRLLEVLSTERHNSISSCTNQENLVYHQNQQRLVTFAQGRPKRDTKPPNKLDL